MPRPDDPNPPPMPLAPLRDYRLRVHADQSGHGWHAELTDPAAPAGTPPLHFDTPLELARHLARGKAPGPGLR